MKSPLLLCSVALAAPFLQGCSSVPATQPSRAWRVEPVFTTSDANHPGRRPLRARPVLRRHATLDRSRAVVPQGDPGIALARGGAQRARRGACAARALRGGARLAAPGRGVGAVPLARAQQPRPRADAGRPGSRSRGEPEGRAAAGPGECVGAGELAGLVVAHATAGASAARRYSAGGAERSRSVGHPCCDFT